jgi:hypothetical protein
VETNIFTKARARGNAAMGKTAKTFKNTIAIYRKLDRPLVVLNNINNKKSLQVNVSRKE